MLINIKAKTTSNIAILSFTDNFSLYKNTSPKLINIMLPALYIGKTIAVGIEFKAIIRKYEENKFGIPTKNPVNKSLFIIFCFYFITKYKLKKKAVINTKNKNTSLYSVRAYC